MPGAGKTVIGKKLAKKLDLGFIDTDKLIEKRLNSNLQNIINKIGEKKFIEIEEQAILGLKELDNYVISPGGSIIYSKKAMNFLKNKSLIIFLDLSFEAITQRIPNKYERGIVGLKNKDLKTIFNERLLLYRKYADMTVKISKDFNMNTILNEIVKRLK